MTEDDSAGRPPSAPEHKRAGWSPNDDSAQRGSILGDASDSVPSDDPSEQTTRIPASPGSTGTAVPPPVTSPQTTGPAATSIPPRRERQPLPDWNGPGAVSDAEVTGGFPIHVDSLDRTYRNANRPYLQRLEQYGQPKGLPLTTILVVGLVLVTIIGGIALLSRLRSDTSSETAIFGSPGVAIVNPTVNEMAQATVQILGLDNDDAPLCAGSGTFVSVDGLILTNAHVVSRDAICDFESIGIAVTSDSGRPPQLLYRAELLRVDTEADLAVLRVTSAIDPGVELPAAFPSLALGDSDTLTIGDNVRILGYPEIGGDTITFTNGSVSGFTSQVGIGDRALIKTDATIAGGNSGGAAVDSNGLLIGIPTKARASENGPAVDCRPLADTNGDGDVDNQDNCVPIGGFLNGIRPVNLARDLIEEAKSAAPLPIESRPKVAVDQSKIKISSPRFSLGEADNNPVSVIITSPGGINELCLFVDWAGIPNGAEWDAIWYLDKEPVPDVSLVQQVWEFGEEGANLWLCALDDQDGLRPGLYELGFFVAGELVFGEGIVLTDGPVELFETSWENATEIDICSLAINPEGSGPAGLSVLPPGQIIAPGETFTIELAAGEIVAEAKDCDGNPIADSGGPIDIVEDRTFNILLPEEAEVDDS